MYPRCRRLPRVARMISPSITTAPTRPRNENRTAYTQLSCSVKVSPHWRTNSATRIRPAKLNCRVGLSPVLAMSSPCLIRVTAPIRSVPMAPRAISLPSPVANGGRCQRGARARQLGGTMTRMPKAIRYGLILTSVTCSPRCVKGCCGARAGQRPPRTGSAGASRRSPTRCSRCASEIRLSVEYDAGVVVRAVVALAVGAAEELASAEHVAADLAHDAHQPLGDVLPVIVLVKLAIGVLQGDGQPVGQLG